MSHIAYTRADDNGDQLKQITAVFPKAAENVYSDAGESIARPLREREDGHDMLESLFKGDVVIVTALHVMFNSLYDVAESVKLIRARKANLVVLELGEEPLEQRDLDLIEAFSSFGIQQRTRIKDGYHGGSKPWGYRFENGRLRREPWLDDVIKLAKSMHSDAFSLRDIKAAIAQKLGRDVSLPTLSKLIKVALSAGGGDLGL